MAEPMGERDVVQLLRENLAEEEAMLHECAEMAKRLAESGAARQAELDRSLVDRLLPGR